MQASLYAPWGKCFLCFADVCNPHYTTLFFSFRHCPQLICAAHKLACLPRNRIRTASWLQKNISPVAGAAKFLPLLFQPGLNPSLPAPSLLSPHSKRQLSGSLVEQLIPQAALSSQNREWLPHSVLPVVRSTAEPFSGLGYFSAAAAEVDSVRGRRHCESDHVHRAQRPRWTFNHLHLCP